jgi:hypothetical protein
MTIRLETRAKVSGRGLLQRSARVEYNITISSTAPSPATARLRRQRHIGDLRKNSFEKSSSGGRATFRDELAKGKIPIDTCARCGDLETSRRNTGAPRSPPYRGLLENTVLQRGLRSAARARAPYMQREQTVADAAR